MPKVIWNPETHKYEAGGKAYGHQDVRKWVETLVDFAAKELIATIGDVLESDITALEFEQIFGTTVKNVHISVSTIAAGGSEQLADEAVAALEKRVTYQLDRVIAFAGDLSDEALTKPQALARGEMYANSAIGTYENSVREREASGSVHEEESRIRVNDGESCEDCIAADVDHAGWQPIGTLPDIGDVVCMANDRCSFQYRVAPSK